ncbi:transporter substrate-binding domain-containing protein [Acidimicrobiales bacterium]|jgi:general L-amino acid transport system substrate-binding protein|nr:transporter substrate-binding domain-containing protein [bacterium]MDB9845672.1 transporter substrate-binding domain-containing protein [Acidimicrobiales bacterium]MDC0349604.1 transporter substrate-binding domain-containing protein [bacterium]
MDNKNKLAKLLALVFAFALLATACGSSSDGDTATTGDDAAQADDSSDAADDATDDAEDDVELTQGDDLLEQIQSRGELNCGVSTVSIGFAVADSNGIYQGFDSDFCRATAAAILGDQDALNIVPLTAAERFTAVQTGEVDVLHRNTTWTQSRDSDVGMDFGPTTYFDGQQLMARVGDGFSSDSTVADIDGAVVCTNAGTTTEKNIAEAADLLGIEITLNTFEDFDIVTQNFIDGGCDIITTDGSGLVGRKAEQQPADQEWAIFPGAPISKEPLGPTYGQNQSRFADAVNWTVFAMLIADEYGVNQSNVDDFVGADGELGRLLGGDGEVQSAMGLAPDAFYQVIKQVGNYSDLWARHLAPLGLKLEGSVNDLWTNGGLMYPPPAR